MFHIRYLTMYKVHNAMHAGAIRKLLYGFAHVRGIIHSLKLVDYLPVHTHKPYNNLHLEFANRSTFAEKSLNDKNVFFSFQSATCVLNAMEIA